MTPNTDRDVWDIITGNLTHPGAPDRDKYKPMTPLCICYRFAAGNYPPINFADPDLGC